MTRYTKSVDGIEIDLTQQEIEELEFDRASALATQNEFAKTQYQLDRAIEYPPITDYIDGVVKGDQAQIQTYINACLAVKTKYPKP
jgi:hypothetical protein